MAIRAFSRSRVAKLSTVLFQNLPNQLIHRNSLPSNPQIPASESNILYNRVYGLRQYHDGRPRGPLWRGKKLIGKEALFVILGLKRFKDDEEKLQKFIKTHVLRLLKMDMIAVLTELERQEEVSLSIQVVYYLFVFSFIAKVYFFCFN